MNMLSAELVHCDGVLQRLHTRLQTEGNLCVTHRVSAWHEDVMENSYGNKTKKKQNKNMEEC